MNFAGESTACVARGDILGNHRAAASFQEYRLQLSTPFKVGAHLVDHATEESSTLFGR